MKCPARMLRTGPRSKAVSASAVAHRVLQTANGVLNFSGRLVDLALALEFLVSGQLAGLFLHFSFCLFGGAFDAILIHEDSSIAMMFIDASSCGSVVGQRNESRGVPEARCCSGRRAYSDVMQIARS